MRKRTKIHRIFILSILNFFLIVFPMQLCGETHKTHISPINPFWGFALDGYPITEKQLDIIEQETGLSPQIVVFFLQWTPLEKVIRDNFLESSLETIWKRGAIPCLTWEPMYYKDGQEIMVPYRKILNGDYDTYITEVAHRIRLWGKPLMIRFAHEMNINRYHWGTVKEDYGPDSPDIYKKMFQYVVTRFRNEGARNVLWVYCPNAESIPNISYNKEATWNTIQAYYPGDDFVDIIGMDGYNWGTSRMREKHGWQSRWQTFKEIFEPGYREVRRLSPHKPIFVFETASVHSGGDKLKWINDALATANEWKLHGIVWFQINKDNDWRIQSNVERSYISIVKQGTSYAQNWIKGLPR